jgi:hypothetical protein
MIPDVTKIHVSEHRLGSFALHHCFVTTKHYYYDSLFRGRLKSPDDSEIREYVYQERYKYYIVSQRAVSHVRHWVMCIAK